MSNPNIIKSGYLSVQCLDSGHFSIRVKSYLNYKLVSKYANNHVPCILILSTTQIERFASVSKKKKNKNKKLPPSIMQINSLD